MDARYKLSVARLVVAKRAPYLQTALRMLVQVPLPAISTMGVSEKGVVYYSPEFVESLSVQQCAGLLVHELAHWIRKHAERCRRANIPLADRKLWNVGLDCAVNPDVRTMGFELPPGGCWPDSFGFAEGLSGEQYYRLLKLLQQSNPEKVPDNSGKGPAYGDCGSVAGNPNPGEPKEPAEGLQRSNSEISAMRDTVAKAIESHAKNHGTIPGSWKHWAEERLTPPQVPWQQRLLRNVRKAVSYRRGSTDYTYRVPSRRQQAVGFGVGKPILPSMQSPKIRVAFVLDTSGSMSGAEIQAALSEAGGILQAVGCPIDFCAVDTQVHELRPVSRVEEAFRLITGRGGTDLRPAFQALYNRRQRPQVIVYATDGYGPAPEAPPRWASTIWLLTGEHTKRPAPWGDAITVQV